MCYGHPPHSGNPYSGLDCWLPNYMAIHSNFKPWHTYPQAIRTGNPNSIPCIIYIYIHMVYPCLFYVYMLSLIFRWNGTWASACWFHMPFCCRGPWDVRRSLGTWSAHSRSSPAPPARWLGHASEGSDWGLFHGETTPIELKPPMRKNMFWMFWDWGQGPWMIMMIMKKPQITSVSHWQPNVEGPPATQLEGHVSGIEPTQLQKWLVKVTWSASKINKDQWSITCLLALVLMNSP